MIPLHDDNPTTLRPILTVTLMVICVAAFFWQQSHDAFDQQLIVLALGVIPATLFNNAKLAEEIAMVAPATTVFTSMFLHGGWMHLIGNMLYLWIFGNNVEDAMGHGKFLAFYLICGILAALAQSLPNPESTVPMVGASGAISGILGAYLLLHPHARVLVLIPLGFWSQLVRIRAVWVLGFWFVMQLINSALSDSSGGGVAFGAHIGGFVAGALLIPLFKNQSVKLYNPFSQ
jgi:membrane associated rhomboid family serine protease